MPKNARLAGLLQAALGDEMTIVELVSATGLTRAIVGQYVRGERKGYVPAEVNVICKRVGLRVEKFLEAAGFDLALRPIDEMDPELLALWPHLSKPARELVLSLARDAASAAQAVQELGASR